jgi:hypothetical protein
MSRSCWNFVGLIVFFAASQAVAQNVTEIPAAPPLAPSVSGPPPGTYAPPPGAPGSPQFPPIQLQRDVSPGESVALDPVKEEERAKIARAGLTEFWGYRYSTSAIDWIIGGGDDFGMVSLWSDYYQQAGVSSGLGFDLGFHFLDGPVQTDMPPRVFDFGVGLQSRDRLDWFGYDVAGSVRASSDFEGSARKGVRNPSHAVGFIGLNPEVDLVFGIDYVDRGDVKLLPVAGLILMPTPAMRFELVFPRPRITFQLTEAQRLYLCGDLGGGSWAVERTNEVDDLATYRDLRFGIGVESVDKDGSRHALEIDYLFSRRLTYTSHNGDMDFDDAVMLRWVTFY